VGHSLNSALDKDMTLRAAELMGGCLYKAAKAAFTVHDHHFGDKVKGRTTKWAELLHACAMVEATTRTAHRDLDRALAYTKQAVEASHQAVDPLPWTHPLFDVGCTVGQIALSLLTLLEEYRARTDEYQYEAMREATFGDESGWDD
jgi:hypothetical protein